MKKQFLMLLMCCSSYLLGMEREESTPDKLTDARTVINVAQRCCEALLAGKELVLRDDAPVGTREVKQVSYVFCSVAQMDKYSGVSNIAPLVTVERTFRPVTITVSRVPEGKQPVHDLALDIIQALERSVESHCLIGGDSFEGSCTR